LEENSLRRCYKCQQLKPLEDFNKAKGKPQGRRYDCRVCAASQNKIYYTHIGRRNRLGEKLKHKEKLAGVPRPIHCPICGSTKTISFDHDHGTGKFRGWICNMCNRALGMVRDNPITLRRLADYLEGKL
jgi:formate dehydrogenase maturation protein FdhE